MVQCSAPTSKKHKCPSFPFTQERGITSSSRPVHCLRLYRFLLLAGELYEVPMGFSFPNPHCSRCNAYSHLLIMGKSVVPRRTYTACGFYTSSTKNSPPRSPPRWPAKEEGRDRGSGKAIWTDQPLDWDSVRVTIRAYFHVSATGAVWGCTIIAVVSVHRGQFLNFYSIIAPQRTFLTFF